MGMKELFQANMAGNRAYRAHAQANRLQDTGKTQEAEKLFAAAMASYIEAEKLGCTKPKLMTGYCVLLMREGQFEKARDLLSKLHASPGLTADDKFHLRVHHVICQWRLGNLDKAIDSMRQAIAHAKTGLSYHVMCALLIEKARETGDFEEAAALCQEALDYDEDDTTTLCDAGWLNYWMYKGNADEEALEKARQYFERANKRNSNHASTLVGLALLAHESGDDKAARAHIDQALQARFPATSIIPREFAESVSQKIAK